MEETGLTTAIVACQSKRDAERLLRDCLEHGEIWPGKHFLKELVNEDLTFQDAVVVLQTGHIYNEPEEDLRTGEWTYRIEGTEPDGKEIAIVFSFKTMRKTFLITVFSVSAKGKRNKR